MSSTHIVIASQNSEFNIVSCTNLVAFLTRPFFSPAHLTKDSFPGHGPYFWAVVVRGNQSLISHLMTIT